MVSPAFHRSASQSHGDFLPCPDFNGMTCEGYQRATQHSKPLVFGAYIHVNTNELITAIAEESAAVVLFYGGGSFCDLVTDTGCARKYNKGKTKRSYVHEKNVCSSAFSPSSGRLFFFPGSYRIPQYPSEIGPENDGI